MVTGVWCFVSFGGRALCRFLIPGLVRSLKVIDVGVGIATNTVA